MNNHHTNSFELPLVSILIPIYGVEKFIEKCVVSLMEQTYANIEYIFVDDCTKDNSITILERVVESYPYRAQQVHILHHDVNKGLSAARNTAFNASTGEYVIHVDSDDYVNVDLVKKCVSKMLETGADIVRVGHVSIFSDKKITTIPQHFSNMVLWRNKMILGLYPHSIWGNLIKRSLYTNNNIQSIEGIHQGEDFAVMPRLAYHSNRYAVVEEGLYYYLVRTNIYSYSDEKLKDTCRSWNVVNEFYKNKEDYCLYSSSLHRRLMSFEAWLIMSWQMSCHKNTNIAKTIISTFPEVKSFKGIDFRKRILLWLFYNYHYRMLNLYIKLSNKLQIILQRRGHNISQ